jgi:hypothetical protein
VPGNGFCGLAVNRLALLPKSLVQRCGEGDVVTRILLLRNDAAVWCLASPCLLVAAAALTASPRFAKIWLAPDSARCAAALTSTGLDDPRFPRRDPRQPSQAGISALTETLLPQYMPILRIDRQDGTVRLS